MNDEEQREDDFLREVLTGQPMLAPPSADFRQRVMQEVAAHPAYQPRVSSRYITIGAVLLVVAVVLSGGYLWSMYGATMLNVVSGALRWLSWDINPTWVLIGLIYGLLARALLTAGVLAVLGKKRFLVTVQ